jgi:hypothetical protein
MMSFVSCNQDPNTLNTRICVWTQASYNQSRCIHRGYRVPGAFVAVPTECFFVHEIHEEKQSLKVFNMTMAARGGAFG